MLTVVNLIRTSGFGRSTVRMMYKVVSGATLVIASFSILAQIVMLPLLFQHSIDLKNDFQARIRTFHRNARTFDNQLTQINKLYGGAGVLAKSADPAYHRFARQANGCPLARPGPSGPPGDPAADGEPGDSGADGASGIDAYQLLLEEAQKCVECPAGPTGPVGAPGAQGFMGPKGDKGDPGHPGKDGIDGEQGEEGFSGRRGLSGKPGRKGSDGAPAPGGQGPPGPPGVKGPIGPTGAQGERGKRNYVIGQPGADGRTGKEGLDGIEGKAGPRGEKGEKGEPGADARFCPCPIELDSGKDKPKSHLSPPNARSPAPQSQSQFRSPTNALTNPPSPPTPESRLGIQPLPQGERRSPSAPQPPSPSAPGNRAANYDDAYPTYDNDQRLRAPGKAPGAGDYDEDAPAADGEQTELRELGQPESGPQRRFNYVTKRPRPSK